MGIYNRDYIRDPQPGEPWGGYSDSWAVKYILIANIALFLLQQFPRLPIEQWLAIRTSYRTGSEVVRVYQERPQGLVPVATIPPNTNVHVVGTRDAYVRVMMQDQRGELVYGLVEADAVRFDVLSSYQLWRLLTYGFLHGSLMHIAFNMYFLWLFGRLVEPIYGSREFLSFYLLAVIVSGLCSIVTYGLQRNPAIVLGASGGVMAVVFLAVMHYPRMKLLFMLVIPIEFRWLALIYVISDLTGFIGGGTNIAHMAHLGGAAFGVAYKHFGWRILPMFGWLRAGQWRQRFQSWSRRPRNSVRIYRPPQQNLDEQVDAILDKIHKHGEASLTDEERATLRAASRRYRKR